MECGLQIQRQARARARICEVDFLSHRRIDRKERDAPRRTESRGVPELLPADERVTSPRAIVRVAELDESAPSRVHAEAWLDVIGDHAARRVHLVLGIQERAL